MANTLDEPKRIQRWRDTVFCVPSLPFGLSIWAFIAVALNIALWVDARVAGQGTGWTHRWVQFDGNEYLRIARDGYAPRSLVWFPLYPLGIRSLSAIGLNPLAAGMFITFVASACAVVLLCHWLNIQRVSVSASVAACLVALTYPYGWYLFGAVHSDALFLALVLAAFVSIERHRPGWGAVFGALATATRPTGIVLIAALFVRHLEVSGVLSRSEPDDVDKHEVKSTRPIWWDKLALPTRFDRKALNARHLLPLCSAGGLIAYIVYCTLRWSRPLGFATEQRRYHGDGWRMLLKQQYFDAFSGGFDGRHLATTTAQGVLLVIVLLSVGAVGKRFGWGYGLFVLGLGMFPGLTVSTFMGIGRYVIPAFPLWALIGERLSRRRWALAAYVVTSASLLGLLTVGFGRSWYLT